MIKQLLRISVATSLAAFLGLFFKLGSSQHFHSPEFVNFITVLWIVSTAAALILFTLRIVSWSRRKDSGFWLDVALMAIWLVAVGILFLVGSWEFAGF
jgi:hypothetical protein